VALALLVTCGGSSSPVAPTPPQPPLLPEGEYALNVSVTNAISPSGWVCEGPVDSFGLRGPYVSSAVQVTADRGAWLARSSDATLGTVELRFSGSGAGEMVPVSGAVGGRVEDFLNNLPGQVNTRRTSWAVIAAGTPLTGEVATVFGRRTVFADIRGPVEFHDSTGTIVRCNGAKLLLSGPTPQ